MIYQVFCGARLFLHRFSVWPVWRCERNSNEEVAELVPPMKVKKDSNLSGDRELSPSPGFDLAHRNMVMRLEFMLRYRGAYNRFKCLEK